MDPLLRTLPKRLLRAYSEGRLAVLVGSGLSMAPDVGGNFPSWKALPERLLDCDDLLIGWTPAKIAHMRAGLAHHSGLDDMLADLDKLRSGLGLRYREALGRIFRPPDARPGDVHRAVIALGVAPLMTTNYDPLLERAAEPERTAYTWRESPSALDDLRAERPVVFKVHGCATDADSVVMASREYDRLAADRRYRAVMEHIFTTYSVLFVGYGVNDPFDLDRLLHGRVDLLGPACRDHFVLIHADEAAGAERWARDYNVHAIPYPDHAHLPAILRALAASRAPASHVPSPTMASPMPSVPSLIDRWRSHQHTAHAQRVLFFEHDHRPALLDEVYVELRVSHPGRQLPRPDDRLTLARLLARPADGGGAGRYAVLGHPGAGKSTLARHLAWTLGDGARPMAALLDDPAATGPLPVPVYLPLVEWAETTDDPFTRAEADAGLPGLAAALAALARTPGRVWLMLDGFDELAAGAVGKTRGRIEQLALDWPELVIVVLSRPIGFDRIAGFSEARIEPLDAPRRRTLLTRWLGDPRGPAAMAAIEAEPALGEAAGNPLLLSLLAMLWLARPDDGALPATRTTLFGAALDILMQRGHHLAGGDAPRIAEPDAARRLLRRLALALTEADGEAWPLGALTDALHETCPNGALRRRFEGKPWSDAQRCLEDIARHTGVLFGDGSKGRWRFMHRALRERLAAERLAELGPSAIVARIRGVVDDPQALGRWGETLGVACALLDAGEQEAPLETLRQADPALTLRVLPELTGLPPELALRTVFAIDPGEALRTWDGDLLVELAARWPDGRVRLWAWVTDDRSLDALAFLHYALGHPRLADKPGPPLTHAAFFGRLRRFESAQPPRIEAVEIPPGAFVMGSPGDEPGRWDHEGPQHRVELTRGFRLGVHPVTIGQYRAFDPDHRCLGERDEQPVVEVSWWRARLFAAWLGGRLPTEAEWEHACRAGTEAATYAGPIEIVGANNAPVLDAIAWYRGNSGVASGGVDSSGWPEKQHPHTRVSTHPVGSKRPNSWGLYDMLGNVGEWVEDWFGPYDAADAVDPAGPPSGVNRVFRGGAFVSLARFVRSAYRGWGRPGVRGHGLGFRVALPPGSSIAG